MKNKKPKEKNHNICNFCGLSYTKFIRHMSCQLIQITDKKIELDTLDIKYKNNPFAIKWIIKNYLKRI